MTREEIESMPKTVRALLDSSVLMPTRQKLYAKLNQVCELAIQALEQEPKAGHWIDGEIKGDDSILPVQICDQCNTFYPLVYTGGGHRYCPNCGAKMEVSK